MTTAKEVSCPTCNATVAMRVSRNGFWQKMVLPSLGIYPWKCGACGAVFLFRHRGYRGLPPGHARSDRATRRAA
jgi:hypothetical protein